MQGGPGDDLYIADTAGDAIIELSGEGIDTVVTSLDWILGANVENLTLTGSADVDGTGNASANRLTGNDGDNVLAGGASPDVLSGGPGNDTLDGGLGGDFLAGGAGDDLMMGGRGGDTYYYGAGWGTDTIEENDTTAGVVDRVVFTNAAQGQVQFARQGDDLVASVSGSTGALVVADWYVADRHRVEQFEFSDGTVLPGSAIDVQAGTASMSLGASPAVRWLMLPGLAAGRLPGRLAEALQARHGAIGTVGEGERLRPSLGDASLERQVANLVESMAAWNAGAAVDAPSRLQPLPWRQPSAEQYLP
jgi:Ca2+-binding RTX toxin-like protein